VRFSKNNNYWGNFRSYYDEVYLRFITEESTGIASLLAGDIRVYARSGGITKNSLSLFSGRNDIELKEMPTSSYQYFGLQCRPGHVFNDMRARQAFSLAIDRQLIADTILPGIVPNTAGWFVRGITGYDPALPKLEYNPEKARQLLRDTGYRGERLVLASNTGTTLSSEILLAVSDMLNDVGFNTTTQVVEAATLLEMRLSGNYDAFLVNAMPGMNDVGETLTQRVLEDYHQSNYKNDRLNDLIRQSNQEFNRERRRQLLVEMNHLINQNWVPQILVNQISQTNPYYKGVTGFQMTSFGQFFYTWVTYDPNLAR
jgi:ABC-type transport system substrate-binding protein